MRIVKILLALVAGVIAVLGGVFVVAIGAALVVALLLTRWLRRQLGSRRPPAAPPGPAGPRATPDVIDVTATEVRGDAAALPEHRDGDASPADRNVP